MSLANSFSLEESKICHLEKKQNNRLTEIDSICRDIVNVSGVMGFGSESLENTVAAK